MREGELLLAGAGAGVISKTTTAPLDRIRMIFQVHRQRTFTLRGFFQRGLDIVGREGIFGLWRGNLAVILQVIPYAGLQFMTFDQYQQLLEPHCSSHPYLMRFVSGAAAGATATTLTYPLDLLRTQMAISMTSLWDRMPHSSYTAAAEDIVRSEAVFSLERVDTNKTPTKKLGAGIAMFRVLFLVFPCLVAGSSNLRGDGGNYVDTVQCTGSGTLPTQPVCFSGSILLETFDIEVVSYDGQIGTVNLKAEGSQNAQCDGAQFENQDNAITIENDKGCGLGKYDYNVRYCPDQDSLIVNLVKPFNVRVVLNSKSCSGEV
eukprot:symbB.v1.2.031784.t1/scaffold3718.1/size51486/5